MKLSVFLALLAVVIPAQLVSAADTNDPTGELKALVGRVNADIKAGKSTETDFSNDLHQFDILLAEHRGQKTDAVAHILFMKAMLYSQVLGDDAKSDALLKQITNDFSETPLAARIEEAQAEIAKIKAIRDSLAVGTPFPAFDVKDMNGKPLSLASYRGKIVLIDFWATWCMPCCMEVPNVIAAYQKYHPQGFDVIGISLDVDKQKLLDFTAQNGMTWPQYFDGERFNNKLAVRYGIQEIPTTFLLDTHGRIIAENLRGEDLITMIGWAVANK